MPRRPRAGRDGRRLLRRARAIPWHRRRRPSFADPRPRLAPSRCRSPRRARVRRLADRLEPDGSSGPRRRARRPRGGRLRPRCPALGHGRRRRLGSPVHRRAGRADPRPPRRVPARHAVPRHLGPRDRRGRARAPGPRVRARLRRRGDPGLRALLGRGRRHHDRGGARDARHRTSRTPPPNGSCSPSASPTPTTTAAGSASTATGMLLVALGDGGSGGDPENRASNLGSHPGQDPADRRPGGARAATPYAIPADNPFVGRSGARPEILHLGLRNPFRASIDPVDRRPVDRGRRPERVGGGRRRPGGRPRPRLRLAALGGPPLLRARRWAATTGRRDAARRRVRRTARAARVIGGVVYRGDAIPALRGALPVLGLLLRHAVGDRRGARRASRHRSRCWRRGGSIASIGTDEADEVYLTDLGGGGAPAGPAG